jgi:hypothetical protein
MILKFGVALTHPCLHLQRRDSQSPGTTSMHLSHITRTQYTRNDTNGTPGEVTIPGFGVALTLPHLYLQRRDSQSPVITPINLSCITRIQHTRNDTNGTPGEVTIPGFGVALTLPHLYLQRRDSQSPVITPINLSCITRIQHT